MLVGGIISVLSIDLPAFATAAGWAHLPTNLAAFRFEATVSDPKFPGALLPKVRSDGSVVWYAAAPTSHMWRQLRPQLLSYAGPTVTNFSGLPATLNRSDVADLVLEKAGVFSFAVLVPPKGGTAFAASALARLVAAVACVPADIPSLSPSTGALLANLDMCLAVGDRPGADKCQALLQAEWRLDIVNLHFVQVRIASAFREWPQLAAQPWFDDLCRVPKPASVAQALLEALWHARLLPYADDAAELSRRYLGEVRAVCLDLLAELPKGVGGAATAIATIEAEQRGVNPAPDLGELAKEQAVTGWLGWVEAITAGRVQDAAAAARMAAMESSASSLSGEEAEAAATQLQDLALRDDGRVALLAALPELVRWLTDDPGYPRSAMRPLYEAALTIFTLIDERRSATREAMLEMFDALLLLEPPSADYRRHLQDVATFVSGEAGTSTAYWLIALAECLLRNSASDGAARLALLNAILTSLQPILSVLTAPQRVAYSRVGNVAHWPPLAEVVTSTSPSEPRASLAGKLVAVYTLTDSAARQAREALVEAFPGARIEVSSDHVCTPRLRGLAREADLFVITTKSAKHAATDCIQRHRAPTLPVVYAVGRGASSILKAVEESFA